MCPLSLNKKELCIVGAGGKGGGGGGGAAAPGECALPDHMLYTNYSGTKISS